MHIAMKNYFARLLLRIENTGGELATVNSDHVQNQILTSAPDHEGWSGWRPLEKNVTTDLSPLERKYKTNFHQDLIDYYNTFWFYELYGTTYIAELADGDDDYMFELNQVVPNQELIDLHQSIEAYYSGGNINNFRMIPIGFISGFYVVIDNETGEVLIDGRIMHGQFFKVTNSIPEFIGGLKI